MSDLDSNSRAERASAFAGADASVDDTRVEVPSAAPGVAPDFSFDTQHGNRPAAVDPVWANGRAAAAPTLTRRGRVSKWDRPPPPKDWRWWVGNLGKTLITTGLLMFGFVAYQLWGTGIETARAQNKLESEFDALLASAPVVTAPALQADVGIAIEPDPGATDPGVGDPVVADPATGDDPEPVDAPPAAEATAPITPTPTDTQPPVPVEEQNIPELENGDALARIEIEKIGVSDIVVAGVRTGDLKKGPGHFPETPLPGQLGNSAIAGHRTTYGAPFGNVDQLDVGDEIVVTTLSGRFTYRVTGQQIVNPSEYWVVATTDPTKATLTLTSCHPKWTARQRIVIFSELVPQVSAPIGEPVVNYGRPPDVGDGANSELPGEFDDVVESGDVLTADGDTGQVDETATPPGATGSVTGNLGDGEATGGIDPDDALGSADVNEGIADAFSESWFSDPAANPHVAFWGVLLALIAIGARRISRRLRSDLAGALIGIVPFTITLYFFFQNVNRLLPPNL